jgi:hypothetical protein
MIRYFEVTGMNQTVQLDLIDGSEATTATVEEISKHLKMDLREIDKKEYTKLTKKFTK